MTRTAALAAALALAGCGDDDHAPYGDLADGGDDGPGGGSTIPDAGDGGADTDTDTETETDLSCGVDEIEQPLTDLCWLRCPIGQSWDEEGGYCSGTALQKDFDGAIAACTLLEGGEYETPSRQQYVDLLGDCEQVVLDGEEGLCDACNAENSDCEEMFGEYGDFHTYWTGTDAAPGPWTAGFQTGQVVKAESPLVLYHVRCVRSL
jgi:hypothetical protein